MAVLNITFHIVGRRRRRLLPPINKIIFNTRSHRAAPSGRQRRRPCGRRPVPMDFSSGTPPALPERRGRGDRFDRLPKKKKPGQARKVFFFSGRTCSHGAAAAAANCARTVRAASRSCVLCLAGFTATPLVLCSRRAKPVPSFVLVHPGAPSRAFQSLLFHAGAGGGAPRGSDGR